MAIKVMLNTDRINIGTVACTAIHCMSHIDDYTFVGSAMRMTHIDRWHWSQADINICINHTESRKKKMGDKYHNTVTQTM